MYLTSLFTSFLSLSLPLNPSSTSTSTSHQPPPPPPPPYDPNLKSFRPIHAHATNPESYQLLWHNSTSTQPLFSPLSDGIDLSEVSPDLNIRTRLITIRRPISPIRTPGRLAYTLSKPFDHPTSSQWEDTEVLAPDVTDRETLRTLAKMTSNAYVLPDGGEWYPLDDWNAVSEVWGSSVCVCVCVVGSREVGK